MKVVLIASQQNRRSGSVYAFEQHNFKVCVMAWASSCCGFFAMEIRKTLFWDSFPHQQEDRGEAELTCIEEELKDLVIKLQGFLRYLWCHGGPRDRNTCPEALPVKPSQFCEIRQQGLGYKAHCFQSFVPEVIQILLPFLFLTWTQICACSK